LTAAGATVTHMSGNSDASSVAFLISDLLAAAT
jgi:hypothetical protein